MTAFDKPIKIDDATLIFPTEVSHLMPPFKDIPDEFKVWAVGNNKWIDLIDDWFYYGLKSLKLAPKEGIDTGLAIRHIKAILGSYQPNHGHKIATCAYLMSEWFSDAQYERVNQ